MIASAGSLRLVDELIGIDGLLADDATACLRISRSRRAMKRG
jgi:hypothetical protein